MYDKWVLLQKCIENKEEKGCQWSGIKANITDRIGLVYVWWLTHNNVTTN